MNARSVTDRIQTDSSHVRMHVGRYATDAAVCGAKLTRVLIAWCCF